MLSAFFTFLARLLVVYLAVFFGTLLIWEVAGVVDREGGKGMALAFVIAPVLALLGALLWPLVVPLFRRRTARGSIDAGDRQGGGVSE